MHQFNLITINNRLKKYSQEIPVRNTFKVLNLVRVFGTCRSNLFFN